MFDVGMSELVVVAVVALVAIGPKDLPRTLRALGRMVAKVRGLAGDFNRHVDDMLREADLQDVKRQMQDVGGKGLSKTIEDAIDPDGAVKRGLELPDLNTVGDPDAPYLGEPDDDEPIGAETKAAAPENAPPPERNPGPDGGVAP